MNTLFDNSYVCSRQPASKFECKMGQARWLHAWTFDKLSLKPICQESQPHHHTLPHLFIQTKNVSHCVIVCLCMLLDSVYLYNVSSLYQEQELHEHMNEKSGMNISDETTRRR